MYKTPNMQKIISTGRIFYGIAMAAVGIQQFFLGGLCSMLFPPWPSVIPHYRIFAYTIGISLLAAGIAIAFGKKAKIVSMILGYSLLALFCFYYVPYEIFKDPYNIHLGSWTNAIKGLALSGGAFAIAGTYMTVNPAGGEKIIPHGRIFFSIMLVCFGIAHFLYTDPISTLIPTYIPGHIFWTYFAGVALIAAGVAIILQIKVKLTGILLGCTIFIWLILLHLPLVVADPSGNNGNSVTSAISALAFSGIAFVIAGFYGLRSEKAITN
jgi:uncharacterized membrane protein